jgi:glycosyltransferase involved in cell wall biosynthesis
MKVLHIIPSVRAQDGGPVEALAGWCDGLLALGAEVTVGTLYGPDDGPPVAFDQNVNVVLERGNIDIIRYGFRLASRLRCEDFDLIHSHGLWTHINFSADRLARERGVPHIISPCGMLAPKALARSALRKYVAAAVFQRRALTGAAMLIANSEFEARDINRAVPNARIAVVPNPVRPFTDCVTSPLRPDVQAVLDLPSERRIVLFVGRLHPVKGIDRLLAVWDGLCRRHGGWHLVLAGPDQGRFVDKVTISNPDDRARIHLPGQVSAAEKWALLGRADLFVMPSDHENFGLAIAEALVAGVPTITTHGTPWKALAETGAGWWVQADAGALGDALDEAMREAPRARRARGNLARGLAANFGVRRVGEQLIRVYSTCLSAPLQLSRGFLSSALV